ncbi:MAG: Ig-like domain-containing protein [Verrucomicrobiales bacterium]|nr:Ig-like domain-containing protein [Verrucomicrobiota bacterium JB025]
MKTTITPVIGAFLVASVTLSAQPVITSLDPVNGAGDVATTADFLATFDQDIQAGTGFVTLYNAADDSVVETYDVESFDVDFYANELYIAPSGLTEGTSYYIQIDSTAVEDTSGAAFAGIADTTTWSFTVPGPLGIGAGYSQDFSTFTSLETLPDGWELTGENTNYGGDWGTGTAGGTRGNGTLGYQPASTADNLQATLTLSNDTGAEITDLTIAYKGRVARTDQGRSPVFTVILDETEIPALSYSTAGNVDNEQKQVSVSGLSIADGQSFQIQWAADRGLGSGSSKQIGISEVSVSVGSATTSPILAGTTLDLLTLTSSGIDVASEVLADGGASVTAMGFVYSQTSLNADPQIGGTDVTQLADGAPGVTTFSATISGLTADTEYSVCSYSTNSEGTSYSPVVTFTTNMEAPLFTGDYTEAFDAFDGTFPAGWTGVSSAGSNSFLGDWGDGSAAGFRGNVSNPGVLGYQHTSGSGTLIVTLTMQNDTGGVLDELWVSYLGRVERASEGRSPAWTVSVDGTDVPALYYTTDGTPVESGNPGSDQTLVTQLTGLAIADGAEFSIIWVCDRGEPSGSSRQIGISNVVLSTSEIGVGDYSTWASMNGVTEGATGDDDNDGIANLMEYGLGLDPQVADGAPGSYSGGVLSFTKGSDAVSYGDVSWTIEQSSDLENWVAVTPDTDDSSEISYTLPTGETKVFVRLVVE